jgi:hypothetical protein
MPNMCWDKMGAAPTALGIIGTDTQPFRAGLHSLAVGPPGLGSDRKLLPNPDMISVVFLAPAWYFVPFGGGFSGAMATSESRYCWSALASWSFRARAQSRGCFALFGPTGKREPSPEGLGMDPDDIRAP